MEEDFFKNNCKVDIDHLTAFIRLDDIVKFTGFNITLGNKTLERNVDAKETKYCSSLGDTTVAGNGENYLWPAKEYYRHNFLDHQSYNQFILLVQYPIKIWCPKYHSNTTILGIVYYYIYVLFFNILFIIIIIIIIILILISILQ